MTENLIEKYLEFFADVSTDDSTPLDKLDDSFAFKRILQGWAIADRDFQRLQIGVRHSFIFCGSRGNGRHTLANAFIQSISQNTFGVDAKVSITLRAEDFIVINESSEGSIRNHVEAIFQCAEKLAEYDAVFIVFDEFDMYPDPISVSTAIVDCLGDLESDRIHVIIITHDLGELSHKLLSSSYICRCSRPNLEQRERFLGRGVEWDVEDWETGSESNWLRPIKIRIGGYTVRDIAKDTEGFSYSDLSMLVTCIRSEAAIRLDPNNTSYGTTFVDIDRETVMSYVAAFKPQESCAAVNAVSVQTPLHEHLPAEKSTGSSAEDVANMSPTQKWEYTTSVVDMVKKFNK